MYRIIPHTADVGIEVSADSIEALFIDAAKGWKYCVIENSPTEEQSKKEIRLSAISPEDLMVRWLNELNFYLTVKEWILHDVTQCQIESDGSGSNTEWSGNFSINGEPLDYEKHEICIEIKSVTYHQLEIEEVSNRYKTRIIFDI